MPINGKSLEQRLAEFTEVHGTVLLGMHRELQTQLGRVNKVIAAAALEEHSNRIASIARQVCEDSEGAKRELANLVTDTRIQAGSMVEAATAAANESLQSVVGRFELSSAAFRHEAETVAERVRSQIAEQVCLLNKEARRLQAMYKATHNALAAIDRKIDAHQCRESLFNRRLRRSLRALAVVACTAVIVGMWQPWIS